jgi:hypothetical protein
LSLKAEKNWHQNSGANRRVVISEVDMGPLFRLASACRPDCFVAPGGGFVRL